MQDATTAFQECDDGSWDKLFRSEGDRAQEQALREVFETLPWQDAKTWPEKAVTKLILCQDQFCSEQEGGLQIPKIWCSQNTYLCAHVTLSGKDSD